MSFSADAYKIAAMDRVLEAAEMYGTERYVMAHYCAGLAVECMLRAYQVRLNAEFDAKHNLRKLAKTSKFTDLFPRERSEEYARLFAEVIARWNNDFRFRSVKSLRKFLVHFRLYEGVKGDLVKESALRIVNAATRLVELGVSKWKP